MAGKLPTRTPPVNAELIEVTTGVLISDGGGGGETVTVTIFEGSAPAYVTEKVEFAVVADAITQDERTQVVIPSTVPGTFEGTASNNDGTVTVTRDAVEIGDDLTYTTRGTAQHTRRITSLEDRTDFGFIRTWTTEL